MQAFRSADFMDERFLAASFANIDPHVARLLPETLALEFSALALELDGEHLSVGFADVPSAATLARITRATGRMIRVVMLPARILLPEIAQRYGAVDAVATSNEREEAPATRAVDELLRRAVAMRASDVHLSETEHETLVRFRIDGQLRSGAAFPDLLGRKILSRLKLLAHMDIGERRLPQDGRFSFDFEGRAIDVRVSCLPTLRGEKLALRLLDQNGRLLSLDDLGLSSEIAVSIRRVLKKQSGFLLVGGPTGSGKTTTLYACLAELLEPHRHICTIEDPVERVLAGATQVQTNEQAGLDFSTALRAILRADPDVLMIGEIRDPETARIAVAAALTGQLVLASIHASSVCASIGRLLDFGIQRSALADALTGIVSQRLIRKLCPHCKRPEKDAFCAVGCSGCDETGYRGRFAIAECAILNEHERSMMSAAQPLRSTSRALRHDGDIHIRAGDTTREEVASLCDDPDSALAPANDTQ